MCKMKSWYWTSVGLYPSVQLKLNSKIWGFHCSDYEECCLLGYQNPVRTSQEMHYVSTTDPSQLMLCKIWDFHSCDYEECCLLGYKNPDGTSQETHYISTTGPSQLMLCKIWGFHGGDHEQCRLLDVTPHGSCKNQRSEGMYHLRHQGGDNQRARNVIST
jgi:hypothetical protein